MAGAAGLAGCFEISPNGGSDRPGSNDGGTSSGSSGAEITGWAWNVAADAMNLTVDPYDEQTDGQVSITIEKMDHQALIDQLRPALETGSNAPDFSILESLAAPSFIDNGGLADLSDRIDQSTKEAFVPGTWEAVSRDGGIYAIPWDVGPVAVFYRRNVYDEHGVDPTSIETWDQFVEEGQKLPDDVSMINLPPNGYDGVWRRQFRQLGGQPFTDDGEVNVDSETSVRVAQNIQKLVDEGITDDLQSWSSDWYDAYDEGSIASLPAGAWMEATLQDVLPDTAGDWGVYKLPAFESGGNRATNWGGSNLCLPKQIDDAAAEQAWDYAKWAMTSPEMQNEMYRKFGIFPALRSAYDADFYDEEVEFFGGQKARRVFAEVAEDTPGYRYSVDTPAVSNAMNDSLGRMVEGELSPSEAVRKAAEQVSSETGRDLAR